MSINLGSNPFGLYLGSSKIGEAYIGSTKIYSSVPVITVPAKTIRFKFSNASYIPTRNDYGNGTSLKGTWTRVTSSPNVWDWYYNNSNWYSGQTSLGTFQLYNDRMNGTCEILAANFSGVTSIRNLFRWSYMSSELYNDGLINMYNITNTEDITNANSAFYGCTAITSVPLFDTRSISECGFIFNSCRAVKSGALALYNQLSNQMTPPTNYYGAFTNCGADTVTGAAELAQIPSSWGGTGA